MKLKVTDKEELMKIYLPYLRAIGRKMGVKSPASLNKEELVENILKIHNGEIEPVFPTGKGAPPKYEYEDVSKYFEEEKNYAKPYPQASDNKYYVFNDSGTTVDTWEMEGVFDQTAPTYGFLRAYNYENSSEDVYVPRDIMKKYNIRNGDKVKAEVKVLYKGESAAVRKVLSMNDLDVEVFAHRATFDDLLPSYPTERLTLEGVEGDNLSNRIIDLFAPIGKGQRGLIVAPPKTGKTTLLKHIAKAIEQNHKEVKLIILLIDERPEEVTDIKKSTKAEVVFSTFDEKLEHHVRAAELVVERAKRLVEVGQDVVILMDSITKLARAYNTTCSSSGKTLSGGIDPVALQGPKRFFGSARNIEEGGSLTIISTALVDTGSRMDDVIYEEFKGTGNMEIHLSRSLSEKRIFPAVDVIKSGTRNEHLLLSDAEQKTTLAIRRVLAEREESLDVLIDMMQKSKSNKDLTEKLDTWLKFYKK